MQAQAQKIIWVNGQPTQVPSTLEADEAAGRLRPVFGRKRDPNLHRCVFCNWCGPHDTYYAHWRQHHRTRAGVQAADLKAHRHV